MRLAVDIGNTCIKVGLFEGLRLLEVFRFELDSYGDLVALARDAGVDGSMVCNVSGVGADCIAGLRGVVPVHVLSPSTRLPFKNCYKTPSSLGGDRIAGVAGAYFSHPGEALLVVDAGTAITYDFLDSAGNYLGGAISPGIELRYMGLHEHTGQLPLVSGKGEYQLLGQSTEECIRAGVLGGVAREVQGYIEALRAQVGDFTVILTGGAAKFLDNNINCCTFVSSNVVLEGLNGLLSYNE